MLDPQYLLELTDRAEDVASRLHQKIINQIIDRIMIRYKRGDKYILTARDKYQLEVLNEAGELYDDIAKEIAKETPYELDEIKKAFQDAGVTSMALDAKVYQLAGISSKPLKQSPNLLRLIQSGYEATYKTWTNLARTTANAAQQLFISECDRAYEYVASGAMSYTEAVKEAVQNIATNGVTVRYPSGHVDTIETATLRCVRTGISQSTAHLTLERAKENEVDLVITTAHMGARPSHEVWQGKVFHVDWSTIKPYEYYDEQHPAPVAKTRHEKYPDFVESTRFGYVDGLCGANCRHNFTPFFEGLSKNPYELDPVDSEENKKAYELSQKQRQLERRIRKTKREVQTIERALKSTQDDDMRNKLQELYARKSKLLTRQNAAYNNYCNTNNLKRYDDRLSIAYWNRSEAQKAAYAARA